MVLFFHINIYDANAIRKITISIIQAMTDQHEFHPSDRKLNISPIPLRPQPKRPPTTKITTINTITPITVNISILSWLLYSQTTGQRQEFILKVATFLVVYFIRKQKSGNCPCDRSLPRIPTTTRKVTPVQTTRIDTGLAGRYIGDFYVRCIPLGGRIFDSSKNQQNPCPILGRSS